MRVKRADSEWRHPGRVPDIPQVVNSSTKPGAVRIGIGEPIGGTSDRAAPLGRQRRLSRTAAAPRRSCSAAAGSEAIMRRLIEAGRMSTLRSTSWLFSPPSSLFVVAATCSSSGASALSVSRVSEPQRHPQHQPRSLFSLRRLQAFWQPVPKRLQRVLLSLPSSLPCQPILPQPNLRICAPSALLAR
jgi:hypothetical protein